MKNFCSLASKALIVVFITAATTGCAKKFEFGVIGDVPYNDVRRAELEALLDEVADSDKVKFLAHAGDIKSGVSECTDQLFADRRTLFDASATPVVYITGDNEWTDCHRVSNGSFDPIERLGKLREVFFDTDQSLGANVDLDQRRRASTLN